LRAVEAAALLHDMGKLAVPEYILNKPGPLTAAEFEKMKLHASVGADILSAIDFPYPVVPIVRHHHENWDGSGYPDGLAGSAIPIGARILSVVDCFDALTSDRPYRPRLSDQEALRILTDRRGKMYDPVIVDTFLAVYREFAPESTREGSGIPLTAIAALSNSPGLATNRLEEISGSSEEMLTLFELARGLRTDLDLDTLCEGIFAHVRRLIPASLCVFFVYEVEADELVAIYVSGESAPLITGTKIALGQRVSGWVAAHRQPIRNSDPAIDLGTAARVMPARPKSSLSTVVTEGASLVGVLTLYSTQAAAFSEEHQRILQAVATQVGGALREAYERSRTFRGSASMNSGKPSPLTSDRLDDRRPAAIILAKLVSKRPADGPLEEISVRTARDVLLMCIRNGDEVFEVQDGLAAVLPNADHTTADLICGRMKDLLAARDPNFRLQTVVVSAPKDGLTLAALLESARVRISQVSRSDSVH
jgi:putative nucleotidyltransferase with HDIG domain